MAGGMKRKGGGKLTIDDFLPQSAKAESDPKQDEEKLKRKFMALAKYHGK